MQSNTILTITGSDPTGESGVQADIKTLTALGCAAVSAITCITLQNTLGIQEFYDVPPQVVAGQIEAIVNDVEPAVVKVGLLRRTDTVEAVVGILRRHHPHYVVYDPVLFSSRGERLMGENVLRQVRRDLFPLCSVVVVSHRDAPALLADAPVANVCYIDDDSRHGLANGFSSALSAALCKGETMERAVAAARDYSRRQVAAPTTLSGRADRLYNEFVRLLRDDDGTNSDVAHYADLLNVGSAYLGQVCRRVAGRSPKSIIDDHLADVIRHELTTTTDTIQQIALRLGFSSQAHLSRFFRNLTGMSPKEFRNSK